MLIEILVTLFVVGYAALVLIGHVALLRAVLTQRTRQVDAPAKRMSMRGLTAPQIALCSALSLVALAERAAASETYPSRPIRIVVPFPAGGGGDATARLVAEGLSRRLGQPIYIENKAGSGGLIGAETVVRAPADGYTILVTSDALTSTPHVLKMNFDPLRDLVAVAQLTRQPVVLAVHPSLGVSTVDELIALARRQPGMSYATS